MKKLFTNVLMVIASIFISTSLYAVDVEIGYGTTNAFPTVSSSTVATYSSGVSEFQIIAAATTTNNSVTLFTGASTVDGLKITSNAEDFNVDYIEGTLTSNSVSSSFSTIELGVNPGTSTGKSLAIVFSSSTPFSDASVLGVEQITTPAYSAYTALTTVSPVTIPTGAKSFRLYRKITVSGTSYGAGASEYLGYVKVSIKAAGPNVSLTSGAAVDTVMATEAMTPIVYGWGLASSGNPTLTWTTSAPSGISAVVNPADSTVTISGTAGSVTDTTTYEYSVEMLNVDTLYGSVTVLPYVTPAPVITAITSQNQSVKAGAAISSIQYVVENAQSVAVANLPADITYNYANDTLTISGTVNSAVSPADYKYVVSPAALSGYSGVAVSDSGVITVLDANATTVYYITSDDASTQANDMLLQGLIANGVDVTVAAPAGVARDASFYDPYDLLVLHESIPSGDAEIAPLLSVDKPILNTKSYFYKTGVWSLGSGENGIGEDSVAVKPTAAGHPIFVGLGDTITLVTGTTSADTKVVQGASGMTVGYDLATLPGADSKIAIHEMTPADRGLVSTSTSKYLMIALFNGMFDQISTDGVTLFTNAITYLLDPTASFTPAASTDSTLSALTVSAGTLSPAFVSTTQTYSVELPYGTTTVPTVSATANDSRATAVVTPASALPGTTSVLVTAEDGSTATYTVSFTVSTSQSSDSTLSALTVTAGTLSPAFVSTTQTYSVELPYGTTAVPTVTATANDAKANASVTQAGSVTGTASVLVTAEDGSTATYTVSFSVATAQSSDSTLSALTVSAGTLSPAFVSTTQTYSVELPYGTTAVPTVTATANDAKANASVTQAGSVTGTASVLVTAEDGSTATYTVSFSVASAPQSSDATLSALTVSAGTLSPVFSASTQSYTVELPSGSSVPTVNATATDNGIANVNITNATSVPGTTNVVVTAEDGTKLTYTITFTVATSISEAEVSALVSTGSGEVIITDAIGAKVSIISISGVVVFSGEISSSLEALSVPQGIYVVSVDGVSTKVLVK